MNFTFLEKNKITTNYPSLYILLAEITRLAPQHETFLDRSFCSRSTELMVFSDNIAAKIILILGHNLEQACLDYLWMCKMVLEEEIYFRRSGEYRLKSMEQAIEEVYSNPDYMKRYMNGLLISQVLWVNHTRSMYFYKNNFLSSLSKNSRHLEIGPGHGLLLSFANESEQALNLSALDISDTSLSLTKHSFDRIAQGAVFQKITADIMKPVELDSKFDSIVMSELLEHLEEPARALIIARNMMNSNAKLFLNIPINSPAADHIYLFSHPNEVLEMVTDTGFEIVDSMSLPMTGYELQECVDRKLTISCVVVAVKK